MFSERGASKVGTAQEISADNGRSLLKVAKVEVYGMKDLSLMNSGAMAKFLSKYLVEKLSLVARKTNKNITVATGVKSRVVGMLKY